VDLEHPEATAYLEIHPGLAYLYDEVRPGPGGLPVGVEGKALALISGGFDSAVAAWLMLKRGIAVDYLFFNLGGELHRQGVHRVAGALAGGWSAGYQPRILEVDFSPVVEAIQERTAPPYWQVLLKRAMLRGAEQVLRRNRYPAMITGDAVGQVSSQTLANLAVISAATPLPVLRPLLGFNKEEIVALARRIGTYPHSADVREYCAILARHPSTHASTEAVEREESRLDPLLIQEAVDSGRSLDARHAALFDARRPHLGVDHVPEGAVLLDLRRRSAYEAWHPEGALSLEFLEALRTYSHFPRDRRYLLYCEFGLKSGRLAELMHGKGFRVNHLEGGLRHFARELGEADLVPR
jgi:thiamine biosynthesis protein ThiI